MTREEFIKQRCKIDNITLEEFEEQYRVVDCNCGKPYCKGYRCLDLDDLLKENQELKKQLEELQKEYEEFQEKASDIQFELRDDRDNYYERLQDKYREQKEFINYLEDEIKKEKYNLEKLCELYKIPKEGNAAYKFAYSYISKMEEILQKYKSIIEDDKQ